MKAIIFFIFIFFLAEGNLLFSQSVGVSIGYGFLSMSEVNDDLQDTENALSSAGINTSDPDKISGGLFIEGSFKYGIGKFNIGVSADYVSSSGNFTYNDYSGSFEENYDVSTTEILALFEIVFSSELSSWQPFIQIAGGIGLANAEHTGELKIFEDPSYNISVKNTVDGNYFAGRIKVGVDYVLQNVMIELAAGYRLANAGELKGDHVENGVTYSNEPVKDMNGNGIEFDYSGVFITAGISVGF